MPQVAMPQPDGSLGPNSSEKRFAIAGIARSSRAARARRARLSRARRPRMRACISRRTACGKMGCFRAASHLYVRRPCCMFWVFLAGYLILSLIGVSSLAARQQETGSPFSDGGSYGSLPFLLPLPAS